MSVTLIQIDSSFFVSPRNRAIFWPSVLHMALYKTLFFDFWFSPPYPQNLFPKILHKIAYKYACMADRPKMFAPTSRFSGMADSMEPYTMLWGHPCCHGNENLANLGYFFTKHRFFFFVSRRNRAIFGRHFSMWHSTKRCSSIFDLGPLTPKIDSPKFALAQNRI